MAKGFTITAQLQGPIFGNMADDIIERAGRDTVKELVELGEQRLSKILRPRPAGVFLSVVEAGRNKASTGNYRRNVNGLIRNRIGIINDGGVVYGPWLEGISSRNRTTRFKGYASFRRTRDFLNKEKLDVARKNVKKAVRRLGGR